MAIDEEWDKHFKDISQKDWDKLISDALKYWDELDNDNDIIKNDSDDGLESSNCPMHPNVFFGLCRVRGFNQCNGYTYVDYVKQWKQRREGIDFF